MNNKWPQTRKMATKKFVEEIVKCSEAVVGYLTAAPYIIIIIIIIICREISEAVARRCSVKKGVVKNFQNSQ